MTPAEGSFFLLTKMIKSTLEPLFKRLFLSVKSFTIVLLAAVFARVFLVSAVALCV